MTRGAVSFLARAAAALLLAACGNGVLLLPEPLICGQPKQHPPPEVPRALCGPTSDFTPVNLYDGEFAGVIDREDAVVLLNGRCTGTLIEASAGPVVLTAGHCVALGDRVVVVFNYEENPDGEDLVTEGTVIEWAETPDYALIALDVVPQAQPVLLTSQTNERLAIIQHPRGQPKVVAEGWFEGSCNSLVYYSDLDTLVGASGAGVLNRQGHLVGIHTDGDCDELGRGTNRGWTAATIVEASEHLVPEDIAAR